jgi:hypothetical protein
MAEQHTQHTRFKRWASRLPPNTAHLVEGVESRIAPILKAAGFSEAVAYGKDRKGWVGANVLAFQIRNGTEWPTAEIFFSPDGRPWFRIELACLGDGLSDREGKTYSREQAVLHDAREYFHVVKDQGTVSSLFSQFGYHWWSLMPTRKLDAELALAERALTSALQLFLQGPAAIGRPAGGTPEGHVAKNLYLLRMPG